LLLIMHILNGSEEKKASKTVAVQYVDSVLYTVTQFVTCHDIYVDYSV